MDRFTKYENIMLIFCLCRVMLLKIKYLRNENTNTHEQKNIQGIS